MYATVERISPLGVVKYDCGPDEPMIERKFLNSPICPKCQKSMVYLYTDIKRWKSSWKCRDCNNTAVTPGYPEEDEGDPSKRFSIFVITLDCEYIIMPGDIYEDRRIRKDYLRLQDKQTEISGRGSREYVSTIYALHF